MIFDGQSGWRGVASLVERNNIQADRRNEGMTVYVQADLTTYKLKPGAPLSGPTSNTDWEAINTTGVLPETAVRDYFTATANQLVYTLSNIPASIIKLECEYNGQDIYSGTDFTLAGNILTLNPSYFPLINAGDTVVVDYTVGGIPVVFNVSSFTNDAGIPEIGSTVSAVTLSWTYSSDPSPITSQTIDHSIGSLPIANRSYLYSTAITTDTTFTLNAIKGLSGANATTSVLFGRKRYWFTSTNGNIGLVPLSYSTISGETNFSQEFASIRQTTKTFDCTGGQYAYIAYPSSYGTTVPELKVNTFPVTLNPSNVRLVSFTNQSGHIENYYFLRTDNLLFGASIPIEVL